MSENQNNMPAPDFNDEDTQAIQAAQNALQAGRNKPLTVPPSAEIFVSEKTSAKYSRFTEQVTIVQAHRSVTQNGDKMVVAVQLRVRQSEVNSGRTLWANFYIAPTAEGLTQGQVEYREKQRGLMFSLIKAVGFMPDSGRLTGALQARLFPQKGEPGKASELIGQTVFAEICQVDRVATDKNGKKIENEDGTFARDVRDNVEGWVADTTQE